MNVAVFMGSRFGKNKMHKINAKKLGKILALNDHMLIYGGSVSGLMGTVAKSVKKYDGKVTGVYPKGHFEDEKPLYDIDFFIEVDNMDDRKRKLIDLADAYVILPGGTGTLEEFAQLLCEMMINITPWRPIFILNEDGFYNGLASQLYTFIHEGFSYENEKLAKHIYICDTIDILQEKIGGLS